MTQHMTWIALAGVLMAAAGSAAALEQAVDASTTAKVKEAIQTYIDQDVAVKDGFLLLAPGSNQPLVLTYDHIHDAVEPHEQGYVACVDFKDRAGLVYDVDMVIALEGGQPIVRDAIVHKVDGKEVAR